MYDSPLPEYGNRTGVPYFRASQEVVEVLCHPITIKIAQDLQKGLGGVVWDCVAKPL
jgi:hypothetical protein